MAEPPAPEELWEEILLRLPPDDPASLLRASLVCKLWRRIVSCRGFLRRLAELHRAPPMLGFFEGGSFVPTTACPAFSLPITERHFWPPCFLDCRHGRALLLVRGEYLLVWEPITGYQRRVPLPGGVDYGSFSAAVVCAENGCDHWSCHGRAFRVVLLWNINFEDGSDGSAVSAFEYSSETGAWGKPLPVPVSPNNVYLRSRGSILVGNSLYFLSSKSEIVRYDLGGQGPVAVINQAESMVKYCWSRRLMHAEDGGLGVARVDFSCRLQLWSQQMSTDSKVYSENVEVGTNSDANAGWVLRRTIHLKDLLPAAAFLADNRRPKVIGFTEGANVIFLGTEDGIFTIEPKSGQARKVCGRRDAIDLFPFISFYAPGIGSSVLSQACKEADG